MGFLDMLIKLAEATESSNQKKNSSFIDQHTKDTYSKHGLDYDWAPKGKPKSKTTRSSQGSKRK